jgi:hypothetical protein
LQTLWLRQGKRRPYAEGTASSPIASSKSNRCNVVMFATRHFVSKARAALHRNAERCFNNAAVGCPFMMMHVLGAFALGVDNMQLHNTRLQLDA